MPGRPLPPPATVGFATFALEERERLLPVDVMRLYCSRILILTLISAHCSACV